MPTCSARLTLARAATLACLALPATTLAAVADMAPHAASVRFGTMLDDDTALVVAQDRAARAAATADTLRRALRPGHLFETLPDVDRTLGLESLRTAYADVQRRVAGYGLTLGDQHPTLVAAKQVLDDLRAQLLDATRVALATAEHDAADARLAAEVIERRVAARTAVARTMAPAQPAADVTGSIATVVQVAPMTHPAPEPEATSPSRVAAATMAPMGDRMGRSLAGMAIGSLAALVAAWALMRSLGARRRRARVPDRRVDPGQIVVSEPAIVLALAATPAEVLHRDDDTSPAHAVPVLAALPLAADIAVAFAREADGGPPASALARAAGAVHATLRSSVAPDARLTVLIAKADGLPDAEADGAALALALGAALAGRHTLLMEARPQGRLRRGLLPDAAVPALLDVAGTTRTLYGLNIAGLTVAVLPSDAGEAEAVTEAGQDPGTMRLSGLAMFDTIVLLGDGADLERLAPSADIALVMAASGVGGEVLAAAATPLAAAGRLCAALLIEPVRCEAREPSPSDAAASSHQSAEAADAPSPRLGLRASFGPTSAPASASRRRMMPSALRMGGYA